MKADRSFISKLKICNFNEGDSTPNKSESHPGRREAYLPARNEVGGAAPYFLGWLLGVPTSVLVIIFLVRGCN